MADHAPDQQIDRPPLPSDSYLPATMVIDVLLDERNETADPPQLFAIDRCLSIIGRRHLLSAAEASAMLRDALIDRSLTTQ